MSVLERSPVAKKAGRPKTGRDDVSVKLDRGFARMAKSIADKEGVTVAEVLGELIRAPLNQRYLRMLQELGSSDNPT